VVQFIIVRTRSAETGRLTNVDSVEGKEPEKVTLTSRESTKETIAKALWRMKPHGLLFMLGTFLRAHRVRSRTWTTIDLVHTYFGDYDDSGTIYLAAEESRLFEESMGESRPPMILPTYERFPTTNRPSPSPSNAPSSPPSFGPTSLPSSMPSVSPTQDPFPESEEPDDPVGSYFSYNPKSPRGPNRW
jgi:hypothetical protein